MTQRTILQADSLPSIDEVNDDIIDNAIVCITTGKYFNITLQELQLYRKLGVPLPTMHPS
jgi:hypothetical protein